MISKPEEEKEKYDASATPKVNVPNIPNYVYDKNTHDLMHTNDNTRWWPNHAAGTFGLKISGKKTFSF